MSENSLKTSRPAKVEYLAIKEEVEALLIKGYTVKDVYNHMREAGHIHVSYSAFCDYVRGQGQRRHGRKKSSTGSAQPALQQSQPIGLARLKMEQEARKKNTFIHETNISLEELIGPSATKKDAG